MFGARDAGGNISQITVPRIQIALDIRHRRGKVTSMKRILIYVQDWIRRNIVDDFENHYPNEPWLF